MAAIDPQPPIDWAEKVTKWLDLKAKAATAVAAERLARTELFGHYFPAPTEGTNTVKNADGSQLKGKYPIDRKVDETTWQAFKKTTVGQAVAFLTELNQNLDDVDPNKPIWEFMRMPIDTLVVYKPELATKVYRTLTAEQKKVMDSCLDIKPGSSAIEYVPPPAPEQAQ